MPPPGLFSTMNCCLSKIARCWATTVPARPRCPLLRTRGADKSECSLTLGRENCLVDGRGEAVERQLLAVVGELLDETHGVAARHEDKADIRAVVDLGDVGAKIGRAQPRQ